VVVCRINSYSGMNFDKFFFFEEFKSYLGSIGVRIVYLRRYMNCAPHHHSSLLTPDYLYTVY
jgi:hypothetical protein